MSFNWTPNFNLLKSKEEGDQKLSKVFFTAVNANFVKILVNLVIKLSS